MGPRISRVLIALILSAGAVSAQTRPFVVHAPPLSVSAPVTPSQQVFVDQFTESVNTALPSHTPNTGTGWTEIIDTNGARDCRAQASTDDAQPSSTLDNHSLACIATPSPALSNQNYDVSAKVSSLSSGFLTRPLHLIFGQVDANDLCFVTLYPDAVSTDVYVSKMVAGTVSTLTSGSTDANFVNGDILTIEARGSGYTIKKGITAILSGLSDTDCDNGNGTGLAWGALRVATDDGGSMAWDDFTVTQIGAAQSNIPPTIQLQAPSTTSPYQTSSSPVVISGVAAQGTAALSDVRITCSGATTITNQLATGTTSWTYSAAVNDGTTVCTATVTDTGALTATSQQLTIVKSTGADTTRPTITWTFPSASPYAAGFTENPITLTFQCSDDTACTTATWVNDQGGSGTCTVPAPTGGVSSVTCPTVGLTSGGVTNTITMTVRDAAGNTANVSTTRQITHIADLVITTTSLHGTNEDVAYSPTVQLGAAGGVSPYTWTVQGFASLNAVGGACTGGALSSGGVISGTFTTVGTCSFTVVATDSQGTPDTDTQALSIVVAASGTEGSHDFFTTQLGRTECNSTTNDGTNCLVRFDTCYAQTPANKGACALRTQAEVVALSTKNHPGTVTEPDYWNYYYATDPNPRKQDAAKLVIPVGDTDPISQMQAGIGQTTYTDGSLTIIQESWYDLDWRPTPCGGATGFGGETNWHGFKPYRLDGGNAVQFNPKTNFRRAHEPNFPCSDNVVWVTVGAKGGNGTGSSTGTLVSPSSIGAGPGDSYFLNNGKGGFFSAAHNASETYQWYPIKATTWTRFIWHVEFNVPGNSSKFNDWREDCDPTGSHTQRELPCENMLATLAAVDPDCAVVDAPDCSSLWSLSSYWACDPRGCQRLYYKVPWHNQNTVQTWRPAEYDGSQVSCDCGLRTSYERNVIMIRNIDAADIDDTGCPGSCPGDSGPVGTNVFRKPVQYRVSAPMSRPHQRPASLDRLVGFAR